MSDPTIFLTDAELAQLTGRRMKSRQIAWLRSQGMAHWVNATGHPVVARTTITGQKAEMTPKPKTWTPRALIDLHEKSTELLR